MIDASGVAGGLGRGAVSESCDAGGCATWHTYQVCPVVRASGLASGSAGGTPAPRVCIRRRSGSEVSAESMLCRAVFEKPHQKFCAAPPDVSTQSVADGVPGGGGRFWRADVEAGVVGVDDDEVIDAGELGAFDSTGPSLPPIVADACRPGSSASLQWRKPHHHDAVGIQLAVPSSQSAETRARGVLVAGDDRVLHARRGAGGRSVCWRNRCAGLQVAAGLAQAVGDHPRRAPVRVVSPEVVVFLELRAPGGSFAQPEPGWACRA